MKRTFSFILAGLIVVPLCIVFSQPIPVEYYWSPPALVDSAGVHHEPAVRYTVYQVVGTDDVIEIGETIEPEFSFTPPEGYPYRIYVVGIDQFDRSGEPSPLSEEHIVPTSPGPCSKPLRRE